MPHRLRIPPLDSTWQSTPANEVSSSHTDDGKTAPASIPLIWRIPTTDQAHTSDTRQTGIDGENVVSKVLQFHEALASKGLRMIFVPANDACPGKLTDAIKTAHDRRMHSRRNDDVVDSSQALAILASSNFDAMPSFELTKLSVGIELVCADFYASNLLHRLQIQWPWDTQRTDHFVTKIQTLKQTFGQEFQVGLTLPLPISRTALLDSRFKNKDQLEKIDSESGDFVHQLRWLFELGFDWINWRLASCDLPSDHPLLERLLNDPRLATDLIDRCRSGNTTKTKLGIEFPWKSPYEAAECILKGLDFVTIPINANVNRTWFAVYAPVQTPRDSYSHGFSSSALGAPFSFGETPTPFADKANVNQGASEGSCIQDAVDFCSEFWEYIRWNPS
jgi:hypothetical protein